MNDGVAGPGVDGENGVSEGSSSIGVTEMVSIDAEEAAAFGCLTISSLPLDRFGTSLLLVLIVRWPNSR